MTTPSATTMSDVTVTGVRAAEVTRLEAAVAAGNDALTAARATAQSAAAALDRTATQASALQQEASVLQQQLAAARTGPERHAVELALNTNRIQQLHTSLDRLAATEAKALADVAVTRTDAATRSADGDLQQARQELTRATADADGDAALIAGLATDYAAAVSAANTLAAPAAEAVTRLGVLLGGDAMVAKVSAAMGAARQAEDRIAGAVTDADVAVRAAATQACPVDGAVAQAQAGLQVARDAATDAVKAAPGRVAAAATVVDAVRSAVPPLEQPVIDAAAQAAVAGTPGAYEAWLVTLPDSLIDSAVTLLDAVQDLARVRAGDPEALRRNLIDADATMAAALSAQLVARRGRAAAAAAADTARAARDAAPGPADLHRAAFLRGE